MVSGFGPADNHWLGSEISTAARCPTTLFDEASSSASIDQRNTREREKDRYILQHSGCISATRYLSCRPPISPFLPVRFQGENATYFMICS